LPHVLRWLIGLATSLIGSHIYLVTLAWAAVQTTTPANVGLILVAGSIPQAALLLIGGVFVDRLGPKPTIIASDVLRTAIMVVFAVVVSGGDVSPLLLGTLAVLFGVVDGFFLPAVSTAPRYLVPRDSLTRVVAAKTIVARGAEFAGAPLGSWLLVVASAAVAFWVNAGLFAVSVVMLALTRMAQPQAPDGDALPDARRSSTAPEMSVWADLVAGVRLIRGYRTLAMLLIIVFVAELGFSGPMMAGVPLLAHQTGWGVRAIGWILGGFGLGAAAAAGFLLWRDLQKRHHTQSQLQSAHDALEQRVQERTEELTRLNTTLVQLNTTLQETALAQAKLLARFRSCRDLELCFSFDRRHLDLRTESSLGHRDRDRHINIVAASLKKLVLSDVRQNKKIAGLGTKPSSVTLLRNSHT